MSVDARGLEAAADWNSLGSPENYVGYDRTENFASPGGAVVDKPRTYEVPERLSLNEWALSGEWKVKSEATAACSAQWTASPTVSTPVIFISSWGRQRQERP